MPPDHSNRGQTTYRRHAKRKRTKKKKTYTRSTQLFSPSKCSSYRCSAFAMSAIASSDAALTLSMAPTALLPTPSAAAALRADFTYLEEEKNMATDNAKRNINPEVSVYSFFSPSKPTCFAGWTWIPDAF